MDTNTDFFCKEQRLVPGREHIAPFIEDETNNESGEGAYILCRNCLQVITAPDERISVEGAHLHTFANPSGIVYEIGCFRSAAGCGYTGPLTDEFTWFKGYNWKIAVCGACLIHLGWLFVASGNSFNGLIVSHLVDSP